MGSASTYGDIAAQPATRLHFVGDSEVVGEWWDPSGPSGFVESINLAWSGGVKGTGTVTIPNRKLIITSSGVNSQTIGQIVSDGIAARVTNFNPDIVVWLCVVNDVINGTSQATFIANYTTAIQTAKTTLPNSKHIVMSCFANGELWSAGPAWGPNATDATILARNADLATLANSPTPGFFTYCDTRGPLLTYESINNAPAPGVASGKATTDGIHPTDAGKLIFGTALFSAFRVLS